MDLRYILKNLLKIARSTNADNKPIAGNLWGRVWHMDIRQLRRRIETKMDKPKKAWPEEVASA